MFQPNGGGIAIGANPPLFGGTTLPKLFVSGGSYGSSIWAQSSDASGTGLGIENTSTGGHKYDLISTGTGNEPGSGAFALYDETALRYRLLVHGNGNVTFPFATAASFGGGTNVMFVGNCTTPPSTNPSGVVVYAEGNAAKVRGGSGTVTTFGPADPHCPRCGAVFTTEHFNEQYGYVSVCLFCLAEDLGDKPYIVRHQTEAHATDVAIRTAEDIAAAKAERLAAACACVEGAQPETSEPPTTEVGENS